MEKLFSPALLLLGCAFAFLPTGRAAEVQAKWLFPRVEQLTMKSAVLGGNKQAVVIHPPAEVTRSNCPVLFFFHGRGRNHLSLIDQPETRAALLRMNYFIVLPNGEDGWYANLPGKGAGRYADYIGEWIELVNRRYPVSRNRKLRGVAGWSMGGYGAIRTAENRAAEFGAAASIIGLLDFPRAETLPEGQNYKVPRDRFGDDPQVWRDYNPMSHLDKLRDTKLFVVLGDSAFDRTMNENFLKAAKENKLTIDSKTLSGGHKLELVNAALPMVLDIMQRTLRAD